MLELIGQYGTNIGLTDEQRAALSPTEEARLVYGSKCLMAGWTCYVTLIWSLKACMLFFYNRLTYGMLPFNPQLYTDIAIDSVSRSRSSSSSTPSFAPALMLQSSSPSSCTVARSRDISRSILIQAVRQLLHTYRTSLTLYSQLLCGFRQLHCDRCYKCCVRTPSYPLHCNLLILQHRRYPALHSNSSPRESPSTTAPVRL